MEFQEIIIGNSFSGFSHLEVLSRYQPRSDGNNDLLYWVIGKVIFRMPFNSNHFL